MLALVGGRHAKTGLSFEFACSFPKGTLSPCLGRRGEEVRLFIQERPSYRHAATQKRASEGKYTGGRERLHLQRGPVPVMQQWSGVVGG